MVKWLQAYILTIAYVNKRVASIVRFMVFALIFFLLYEAVLRYGFNKPPKWTIELCLFIIGGYFLLSGGYALLRGAHVRMDAFYDRWSLRRRALIDVATSPLIIIYLSILILASTVNVIRSISIWEHAHTVWAPILWPIKICIPIGAALLMLQGIAFLIRDIFRLRGKELKIE